LVKKISKGAKEIRVPLALPAKKNLKKIIPATKDPRLSPSGIKQRRLNPQTYRSGGFWR
jgi:hypothetical protein